MATLPTDDEELRMALDIFKHFGTRPGGALLRHNVAALVAKNGLRMEDVTKGIELGYAKGFFEDESHRSIKLTEAGFAAIAFGQMPVTHDALVARLGLEIGVSPQKVSDFRLDGLREQDTRPAAQNLSE